MIRRLALLLGIGALGLVVGVPSAAAGGGCHAPADIGLTTGRTAHIAECAFQPTVTYIEPGETVTWTNKDLFDHTVTGAASSWGSDSPIAQGESVSFAFDEEGVFPYYCAYHPSMVGAVVVGDATGAAGSAGGISEVGPPADDPKGAIEGGSNPPVTSPRALASFAAAGLVAAGAVMIWRTMARRRSASGARAS